MTLRFFLRKYWASLDGCDEPSMLVVVGFVMLMLRPKEMLRY